MRDDKGRFVKGHSVPKEWIEKYKEKAGWQSGEQRYNWKGVTYQKGYRFLRINGKNVREHNYVWIRESGWNFIPKGFVVHHINQDKLDNRIENLACIPRDIHLKIHNPLASRWGIA